MSQPRTRPWRGPSRGLPTFAHSAGPGPRGLIPHNLRPPAQLVLAPGVPNPLQPPRPGTHLVPLHRCGCGGGAPTKGPPRRPGLYLPSPWPGQAAASGLSPPSPAGPGLSRPKTTEKCLFVPVVLKAKQFVVCDPNFLPFFQNITKLKTTPSPSPHPPGRQKRSVYTGAERSTPSLPQAVPSALGGVRGRGRRPGQGGERKGHRLGWELLPLGVPRELGIVGGHLSSWSGDSTGPFKGAPRSLPSAAGRYPFTKTHQLQISGLSPELHPVLPTPRPNIQGLCFFAQLGQGALQEWARPVP